MKYKRDALIATARAKLAQAKEDIGDNSEEMTKYRQALKEHKTGMIAYLKGQITWYKEWKADGTTEVPRNNGYMQGMPAMPTRPYTDSHKSRITRLERLIKQLEMVADDTIEIRQNAHNYQDMFYDLFT